MLRKPPPVRRRSRCDSGRLRGHDDTMVCRLCLYSLCISCCSVGFTEAPIMRCHISAGLQPPSPM